MTVLSAVFCIAGFAVSAAALISGAFYLIAYRPYAKKKQASARAAVARAGGLAALGSGEKRSPDTMSSVPRPPTAVSTHP